MKMLIFGNGQIGNMYKDYFSGNPFLFCEVKLPEVDIVDEEVMQKIFEQEKPDVVINTAAKTNLEFCEANEADAFEVNVLGAQIIAELCEKHNAYMVHLSSGCIFQSVDENDLKTEKSEPQPACYYAKTKVRSEKVVREHCRKHLILRPRQPISSEISYKNMLIKFLTFTQFIDTPNTGTVLEDLMVWTAKLIDMRYVGTVNVANTGYSTPLRIAEMLKKHVLPELPIERITKEQLDKITPTKRVDTVLDVSLLKELVGEVRSYDEALEDVVKQLGNHMKMASPAVKERELTKAYEFTKQRAVPNEVWGNLI